MKLLAFSLLSLVVVAGCATGRGPAVTGLEAAPLAAARPGDLLKLSVWREPDLSGEFVIDENGTVVLPMVGPVSVRGASPAELRARVVDAYRVSLNHSSVTVTLLRRVRVAGAVKNPGLYSVDETMALGDIIALAGGVTPLGNADRVQLVRGGIQVPSAAASMAQLGAAPIQSGDQLFVPERNWAARYPSIIAASITAVATLALTRRHK